VQPYEAPRLDLRPHNLEPVRAAPGWRRNPMRAARPAPQGRVEECPPRATGVRVQDGLPNVAVRAARSLDTPRGVCGRAEPSAGAAGTQSATSCKSCLTSQAARGCFTRASAALCCRSHAVIERRLCFGSRQARRPQPPQISARTSAHVAAAVL
jgi:hypothetical protein